MKIIGWILFVFGNIMLIGRILYIIKGGEQANVANLIIALVITLLGYFLLSKKKV